MTLIYVDSKGNIRRVISAPESAIVVEDLDGLTHYFVESCPDPRSAYYDGEIKQKTAMSISAPASGSVGQTIVIEGIPEDTTVIWPDGLRTEESGSISFDTNTTGDYRFRFINARYFEQRVIINVT